MTIEPKAFQEIPYAEFVELRNRIATQGFRSISKIQVEDLILRTKRKEKHASELLLLIYDRLICYYAKFNAAKKKSFSAIDVEESKQECRICLLRAVERYDPDKGAFTSYAVWWIKSALQMHNSGDPIVWIDPRLFTGKERHIDLTEVALCRNVVSLDDRVQSDIEEMTIGDTIASEEDAADVVISEVGDLRQRMTFICSEMKKLPIRDRKMIALRWFADPQPTLEEVGDKFNLSGERVRQIEANFFSSIRNRFGRNKVQSSSSV